MHRRSCLIAAVVLGTVLTAVTATAQPLPATIKIDKVLKVNVGSFDLKVTWDNCNNMDSVLIHATDKNGTVLGSKTQKAVLPSGTLLTLNVPTKANAGDTVTFQAFARDANGNNIAIEVPPFKTAVAK